MNIIEKNEKWNKRKNRIYIDDDGRNFVQVKEVSGHAISFLTMTDQSQFKEHFNSDFLQFAA